MTRDAGTAHYLEPLLRVLPPALGAHQRQLIEHAYNRGGLLAPRTETPQR
ncbi:hypothetical protein Pve01_07210 [Planomonospora venezuelensis]|nr:hypothetical protein Pve01_07210 [Planomonospora venezuelensis]